MHKASPAQHRRILIQTVSFPSPSFHFNSSIIDYLHHLPKLFNDVGIAFPVSGRLDGFGSRTWMGRIFALAENNEVSRPDPHELIPPLRCQNRLITVHFRLGLNGFCYLILFFLICNSTYLPNSVSYMSCHFFALTNRLSKYVVGEGLGL